MGKAKLQKASDGHFARVAPTWTEEKLRILGCYLEGFAKACKRAGGWYSLDLFAGGGLNISETTGAEIPGSPLIALEARSPEATTVVLCEQGRDVLAALRYRTADYSKRAEILDGDANQLVREMLSKARTKLQRSPSWTPRVRSSSGRQCV